MAGLSDALLHELTLAHRILVNEGVMDPFGHVSLRDPSDPSRFWLARAVAPLRVVPSDFLAFGLDGEPVSPTREPLYAERWIHSEIFARRPDVMSVCHHHAAAIMPFCIASAPLIPVSQTAAFMGGPVPVWDSADEFGDTPMLVTNRAQAASLARTLGDRAVVLMRGHGATVAGRSVRDTVYKSVYSCRDADYQRRAAPFGALKPLSPGEIEAVGHAADRAVDRCWSHWSRAVEDDAALSGDHAR
jgi:ribulose-5-phosphate 4-epimerase/fuculose-1-phosphate aldolase